MASLEPCRYCNGEGWITPQITEDKKQMDDIDKMLLRMFGQQRIKKLCPGCHGSGKDDITRWR